MSNLFISSRSLRCAELVEVSRSKCFQFTDRFSCLVRDFDRLSRLESDRWHAELVEVLSRLESDRWHAELVEVLNRLDSDRLRAWFPALAYGLGSNDGWDGCC